MIDKEKGNLVKADRFGYVKRAMHGTKMLSNKAVRYILLFNTIGNVKKKRVVLYLRNSHSLIVFLWMKVRSMEGS